MHLADYSPSVSLRLRRKDEREEDGGAERKWNISKKLASALKKKKKRRKQCFEMFRKSKRTCFPARLGGFFSRSWAALSNCCLIRNINNSSKGKQSYPLGKLEMRKGNRICCHKWKVTENCQGNPCHQQVCVLTFISVHASLSYDNCITKICIFFPHI